MNTVRNPMKGQPTFQGGYPTVYRGSAGFRSRYRIQRARALIEGLKSWLHPNTIGECFWGAMEDIIRDDVKAACPHPHDRHVLRANEYVDCGVCGEWLNRDPSRWMP